MSEFEFMRYVTIGQYLPTGSPIHRLDPRARLVGGMLLVLALTAAPHLTGLLIGAGALLALLALSRVPLRYALRGLLPPLPMLAALALLQILFGAQQDAHPLLTLGPLRLSLEDLQVGLMLIARFAALILGLSLLSFTLSSTELVHALESLLRPLARLGLPTHDFVLMVQVALRFIPLLAREAERIAKAQASRGADWSAKRTHLFKRVRQTFPLLIPLFMTGLQKAENLALAMEARGYGDGRGRTSLVALRFRLADAASIFLAAAMAMAIALA